MNNYYSYKKKLNELEEQELEQRIKTKEKESRKEKNEKLVKNYDTRVANFIFSMTKNPIVINDVSNSIVNPRFELLKQNDNKKPFVFTDFALDKRNKLDFINQTSEIYKNKTKSAFYSQDKNNLNNSNVVNLHHNRTQFSETKDKANKIENETSNLFKSASNNFKGKTFYQDKNLYDSDPDDKTSDHKEIKYKNMNKQRNSLASSNINRKIFHPLNNTQNYLTHNNFYKTEHLNEISANKSKQILLDLKRLNISSKSGTKLKKIENIFEEVSKNNLNVCHKTHFKAASVIANNRKSYNDNNLAKPNLDKMVDSSPKEEENLSQSLPKFKERTLKYTSLKGDLLNLAIINKLKQNENLPRKSSVIIQQEDNKMIKEGFFHKFSHFEDNLDVIKSNPLLYNININKKNSEEFKMNQSDYYELNYLKNLVDNKKKEELIEAEQRGIKFLKKLKMGKRRENALMSENPKTFFKNYIADELDYINRDDGKIWVDSQPVPKTQLDVIAQKILKNCNFVHQKNKNNQTNLKKGEGKVMITQGLSLNEFRMKFKLPI